jgi:hypothetical protein
LSSSIFMNPPSGIPGYPWGYLGFTPGSRGVAGGREASGSSGSAHDEGGERGLGAVA